MHRKSILFSLLACMMICVLALDCTAWGEVLPRDAQSVSPVPQSLKTEAEIKTGSNDASEKTAAEAADTENTGSIENAESSETEPVKRTYKTSYISYQLNGGINTTRVTTCFSKEDLPVVLEVPEKEGYNFAGWFLDPQYQEKVTQFDDMTRQTIRLYAKWTEKIDDWHNVENYNYSTIRLLADNTERELKDCSYSFLEQVEIPGMPSTREMDSMQERITSANQCPQGICMTDDYILITSYCAEEGTDNLGCLYVFDKEDGTYLVTLGMKKKSHLGGITFDGSNVWICHSDNNTIERVSYEFIRELAEERPERMVDCSEDIEAFEVNNRPSCITYYSGKLMVATQTVFWNSKMKSYIYEDGKLVEDATYNIPNKVQGIAFDENGSVYVSTSYGRNKSSYLKVYGSLLELNKSPNDPRLAIEMPPCSEEIEVEDGCLYVLFESAGYKYFEGTDGNGTADAPLDKILSIDLASM